MAGEFEISVDDLIPMLRSMDVPVLSPQSGLTDDQVSRIRARWEREKRVRQAKANAPAPAAARRRKGAAAPVAPPVAAPPAVVSETPEPEAGVPAVRRRKAADVAAQQAIHDAVAAAETEARDAAEATRVAAIAAATPAPVEVAAPIEPSESGGDTAPPAAVVPESLPTARPSPVASASPTSPMTPAAPYVRSSPSTTQSGGANPSSRPPQAVTSPTKIVWSPLIRERLSIFSSCQIGCAGCKDSVFIEKLCFINTNDIYTLLPNSACSDNFMPRHDIFQQFV